MDRIFPLITPQLNDRLDSVIVRGKDMKKILLMYLLLFCGSVNATTYNFYQGGFSEGAFVTGQFTGVDLNNDGMLSYIFGGEISNFNMSFSGNSEVGAFETNELAWFGRL